MAGILSDAPVGILDPRSAMLTQMGLGLLQSGGPSRTPVSFGQSFGQAGAQGLHAFQQANQANQQNQLFQMKVGEAQREEEERKNSLATVAQFKQEFPHLARLADFDIKSAVSRAFPEQKSPKYQVVGNRLIRTDTETPAVAYESPEKDDEFARVLKAAGIQPGTQQWEAAHKARLGKMTTHPAAPTATAIAGKGDSTYVVERLKGEASNVGKLYSAADSAMRSNAALDRIAANNDEAFAGALAPVLAGAANLFSSFGYDSKALTSTAAIQQAASEMLANRMAELGARGLTDKDMQILRDNMPKVESSKEARMMVVNVLKKANEGTIIEAQKRRQQELKQYPELKDRTQEFSWETFTAGPRAAPKPGDVVDGWQFIGGDPGNRMNWRKAK
jgi:hypothetical protein